MPQGEQNAWCVTPVPKVYTVSACLPRSKDLRQIVNQVVGPTDTEPGKLARGRLDSRLVQVSVQQSIRRIPVRYRWRNGASRARTITQRLDSRYTYTATRNLSATYYPSILHRSAPSIPH